MVERLDRFKTKLSLNSKLKLSSEASGSIVVISGHILELLFSISITYAILRKKIFSYRRKVHISTSFLKLRTDWPFSHTSFTEFNEIVSLKWALKLSKSGSIQTECMFFFFPVSNNSWMIRSYEIFGTQSNLGGIALGRLCRAAHIWPGTGFEKFYTDSPPKIFKSVLDWKSCWDDVL